MDSEAGRVELLAPCPFCGKQPAVAFGYELGHWDIYEVECADCGYSIGGPTGWEGDKAKAATIERWNTRPTPDNGLREALEPFARAERIHFEVDDGVVRMVLTYPMESPKTATLMALDNARLALSQAPR